MTVLSRLTRGAWHVRHLPQYIPCPKNLTFSNTLLSRGLRQPRGKNRQGGMNLAPKVTLETPHMDRMGPGLFRSTLFAAGFCGATFVGATIWQYERLRDRLRKKDWSTWISEQWNNAEGWQSKEGEFRKSINRWWNELTEGQKVFWPICFLNGVVFALWNNPGFQNTMLRYFASNPAARAVCWPMLLSTFSHYAFLHFGMNMYVLHSFSTTVCRDLGREQFVAMYLSCGVLSSLASQMFKVFMRCPGYSLGASGAIMGVLGYFCTRHPDAQLAIVFLPGITFSADSALKCVMCLDTVGMVLGWRMFDHAAHLGGALAGLLYAHFGQRYIWPKNEPIMRMWHNFRNQISESPKDKRDDGDK